MKKYFIPLISIIFSLTNLSVTAQDVDEGAMEPFIMMGHACTIAPHSNPICQNVAEMLGRDYKAEEYDEAVKYFSESCEANNPTSCGLLGSAYFSGTGVTKNETTGRLLLTKACKGRDASACFFMTELTGKPEFSAILTKACEGKDGEACFYVGKTYFDGLGVERSVKDAHTYYQQSCKLGHQPACEAYSD